MDPVMRSHVLRGGVEPPSAASRSWRAMREATAAG
jgi:hypothetical protein